MQVPFRWQRILDASSMNTSVVPPHNALPPGSRLMRMRVAFGPKLISTYPTTILPLYRAPRGTSFPPVFPSTHSIPAYSTDVDYGVGHHAMALRSQPILSSADGIAAGRLTVLLAIRTYKTLRPWQVTNTGPYYRSPSACGGLLTLRCRLRVDCELGRRIERRDAWR